MSIIITRANINRYRKTSHADITRLEWRAGPLDATVLGSFPNLLVLNCQDNHLTSLAGLEACPQLLELNCNNNKLTSLAEIGLCSELEILKCRSNCLTDLTIDQFHIDLRILDCAKNKIAGMAGIECFPLLCELNCSDNQLISSIRTEACTTLLKLDCSGNTIHTASAIGSHPQLRELVCSYNDMVSLTGLSCPKLKTLYCGFNNITSLAGLNCPELVLLYCSANRLVTLAGIESCPLLKQLNCWGNNIRTLTGLVGCPLLELLDCSQNHLRSLEGLNACPLLKQLDCKANIIESLTGIRGCLLLEKLYCSHNRLNSLEGLCALTRLQRLDCLVKGLVLFSEANHIRQLINLVYLRIDMGYGQLWWKGNIHHAWATNNPCVCIDLARATVRPRDQLTVYDDKQNVHDAHIHETVIRSIGNLMKDPRPVFTISMLNGSGLSLSTISLLTQFCKDTTRHSSHRITYCELLGYVWARIIKSVHKAELLKILEEQVTEAADKCLTGKFTRTLSVLVGFYEDIMIEISDSSRIGAIILAVRDRVWPCEISELRTQAHRALIEAGYEESMIEPWILAIV